MHFFLTNQYNIIFCKIQAIKLKYLYSKKDDKNDNGSQFEMFLHTFIHTTWHSTCTMWINISIDAVYC